MIYLTRRTDFSASRYYHNPALGSDENRCIFEKCNNPRGHGHNYTLEVTVAGQIDPATGMDHKFLNLEVPEFASRIATTENIAIEVWRIAPKLSFGRLHCVRLYQTATCMWIISESDGLPDPALPFSVCTSPA
jgi:6-pyruvoyltetrahydropterin/6-carboxytetrahydropterin synthase